MRSHKTFRSTQGSTPASSRSVYIQSFIGFYPRSSVPTSHQNPNARICESATRGRNEADVEHVGDDGV